MKKYLIESGVTYQKKGIVKVDMSLNNIQEINWE